MCVSVLCAGAESGVAEAAGGDTGFRAGEETDGAAAADGHSRRGQTSTTRTPTALHRQTN